MQRGLVLRKAREGITRVDVKTPAVGRKPQTLRSIRMEGKHKIVAPDTSRPTFEPRCTN